MATVRITALHRHALMLTLLLATAACGYDDGAAASGQTPTPPAQTIPHEERIDAPKDVPLVLPGAIGPETDVTALRRLFGSSNVHVGGVPGPEGTTAQGVTLFANDPARRAHLYFQEETTGTRLTLVSVKDRTSRWSLDSGVRIGMPLSQLLALNGKPVKLMGFDWDYGGFVIDWNRGRLAQHSGDTVRRGVRLDTRPTDAGHPAGSYPMGDGEFSSDDPRYPRLGDIAEVGEISVSFPGEDDP